MCHGRTHETNARVGEGIEKRYLRFVLRRKPEGIGIKNVTLILAQEPNLRNDETGFERAPSMGEPIVCKNRNERNKSNMLERKYAPCGNQGQKKKLPDGRT